MMLRGGGRDNEVVFGLPPGPFVGYLNAGMNLWLQRGRLRGLAAADTPVLFRIRFSSKLGWIS